MALTATNSILVSAFPSIDSELFDYIEGKYSFCFTNFFFSKIFKFCYFFLNLKYSISKICKVDVFFNCDLLNNFYLRKCCNVKIYFYRS